MGRGKVKNAGHVLLFDGLAQQFDSIPIRSAVVSGGAAAVVRTSAAVNVPALVGRRLRVFYPPQTSVVPSPTDTAMLIVRGRPAQHRPLKRRVMSVAVPPAPSTAVVPRGPAGAATIIIDVEDGAAVTYSWKTDVLRSVAGVEKRASMASCPREAYDFAALVDDAALRAIQTALFKNAATAQPFLLGLVHEGVTIDVPTAGNVVDVGATAYLDWAEVGQRVVVWREQTGESITTYIVAPPSGSTLSLHDAVGAIGTTGTVVMPAMAVYLDPRQTFGQYAVNAQRWQLKATAILFGNSVGAWPARGGSVTTFAGLPVFNRAISANDVVARALASGAEVIDRGGALAAYGPKAEADIPRQLRYTARSDADRQWMKAFLGAVRGQWKPFFLPTWRPDLDLTTDGSTGTITFRNTTDYVNVFKGTPSHQWLQFLMADGTVQYRTVADATDNFDGTQSILLSAAVVGAIATCSFLELCRLNTDDVEVVYDAGSVSHVDLQVLVNL